MAALGQVLGDLDRVAAVLPVHLGRDGNQLPVIGQRFLRWQALMLPVQASTPPPQNGLFALSRAFDFRVR